VFGVVGTRSPVDRVEASAVPNGHGEGFVAQVRDGLAHLYDPAYLQTHPLTRYLPTDSGATSARKPALGRQLRQCLLDAIEALRPGPGPGRGTGPGSGRGAEHADLARHSTILQLRYVEGLDPQEVQSRLAISRTHYYREQAAAVEAVA
jgi:hypothetical protein